MCSILCFLFVDVIVWVVVTYYILKGIPLIKVVSDRLERLVVLHYINLYEKTFFAVGNVMLNVIRNVCEIYRRSFLTEFYPFFYQILTNKYIYIWDVYIV